jgi:hypothetical protein
LGSVSRLPLDYSAFCKLIQLDARHIGNLQHLYKATGLTSCRAHADDGRTSERGGFNSRVPPNCNRLHCQYGIAIVGATIFEAS